jgi:hypothetical protein
VGRQAKVQQLQQQMVQQQQQLMMSHSRCEPSPSF